MISLGLRSSCPRLREEGIHLEEKLSVAILLNSLKTKIMLLPTFINSHGTSLPRSQRTCIRYCWTSVTCGLGITAGFVSIRLPLPPPSGYPQLPSQFLLCGFSLLAQRLKRHFSLPSCCFALAFAPSILHCVAQRTSSHHHSADK